MQRREFDCVFCFPNTHYTLEDDARDLSSKEIQKDDCLTMASLDSAEVSSEFLVPPGERVEGDNLLAWERRSS